MKAVWESSVSSFLPKGKHALSIFECTCTLTSAFLFVVVMVMMMMIIIIIVVILITIFCPLIQSHGREN